MVVFNKRSEQKELLDADEIPAEHLHRNLYELDVINRLLGGHAVTLAGLGKLNLETDRTYSILDIGSGGGDTLKAIAVWGKKKGLQLQLTGVDLKKDCIDYARFFCKDHSNIHFIQSDYRDLASQDTKYDIIITSLFCHHLTNEELGTLFSWAAAQTQRAFVMNDLHRNRLAYYSISWLTRLFSRSYLVKNDARLSVLRGFRQNELLTILEQAGILHHSYQLQWKWAFRWLLILHKK